MKNSILVVPVIVSLLSWLVSAPADGQNVVLSNSLSTGGEFHRFSFLVPDEGMKQKHPKRALRAEMIVDPNLLKMPGGSHYLFCFDYTRFRPVKRPNRGHVKALVEIIKSNGEQIQLAELSARVIDHTARDCSPWFGPNPLDLGDVVLFDFKFRKMPPFDRESQGATFTGWITHIFEDVIITRQDGL